MAAHVVKSSHNLVVCVIRASSSSCHKPSSHGLPRAVWSEQIKQKRSVHDRTMYFLRMAVTVCTVRMMIHYKLRSLYTSLGCRGSIKTLYIHNIKISSGTLNGRRPVNITKLWRKVECVGCVAARRLKVKHEEPGHHEEHLDGDTSA